MAKKILILLTVLALSLIFVGCGEQKSELDMIKDSINHEDIDILIGSNDNYRVEILTTSMGKKSADKTDKDSNCQKIMRLYVSHSKDTIPQYKVVLKGKDGIVTQEVPMTKDILGMSYSVMLTSDVYSFNATIVDIIGGEKTESIELVSALKDCKVDSMKAVDIAYTEMKDNIKEYFEGDKYIGTTVVKLIHNRRVPESPYYFYVSFIKDDSQFVSCLIDPKTALIVNKKTK